MSHVERLPRITIIGAGSPYGADQLGWQAVAWLQGAGLDRRFPALQLTFLQAERPGALLLQLMHGAEGAVLIDAMRSGLPGGTVRVFAPSQVLLQHPGLLSSHAFGVAEAIALGAALDELPGQLTVIGIEMGEEPGAGLAAETAQQLVPLVEGFLGSMQRGGAGRA